MGVRAIRQSAQDLWLALNGDGEKRTGLARDAREELDGIVARLAVRLGPQSDFPLEASERVAAQNSLELLQNFRIFFGAYLESARARLQGLDDVAAPSASRAGRDSEELRHLAQTVARRRAGPKT